MRSARSFLPALPFNKNYYQITLINLKQELQPKVIRVNALNPGMIATIFHDDFSKDQVRVNLANATPSKRKGNAEEVADLVAYLAGDESSFLSGINVDIDGGLTFSQSIAS